MAETCDIAIVGGGFSGLAVLANLVRSTSGPLNIICVSRDNPGVFGPAYSTPRPEHLLNVRAEGMGLFDDDHAGFHAWAAAQDENIKPGDYLPRRLYAEYLSAIHENALAAASHKNMNVRFVRAEVSDIQPRNKLQIITDGPYVDAAGVVLAIGNTLKAREDAQAQPRLVADVWNYDYEALAQARDIQHIAVVGSGLTALDSIISLLNCGWRGRLTCLSGSALLPMAHPAAYDKSRLKAAERAKYVGQRPSRIMHELRKTARGADWPYAIDSLRSLTQPMWNALSPADRLRVAQKYFNLWNIHRHRCDSSIRAQADAAIASGRLAMVRARCTGFQADAAGVDIGLQQGGRQTTQRFDLAFKCIGVNYAAANNPLLTTLLDTGVVKGAGNPYGIAADENFRVYDGPAGVIHALGTPLFGQLFETTAVPELRHQSARVAADIISLRSGLSQSRAAGAGE